MTTVLPDSNGASDAASERKWWLAIRGRAQGPYTAGYITASLRTNSLVPETLACLVGSQDWSPLTKWTEFGPGMVPPPVPPLPLTPRASDGPFTNANLPSMANWLCVYCILWRPVVSVFAILNWSDSPPMILVAPPTSLIATAALVTGGILLRQRRRIGMTIIKATLWVSLGVTTLLFVTFFSSASNVNPQQATATVPQVVSSSQSAAGALIVLLWLLEVTFQAFAVVWLGRNGNLLPYLDHEGAARRD